MNDMLNSNDIWNFSGRLLENYTSLTLSMDLFDNIYQRITSEEFDYHTCMYE